MAYTLRNLNVNSNVAFVIGSVESERMVKNAEVETLPLPMSDSNQTILFDNEGVIRTISLTGRFTADTQAELMNDFIERVEKIVNGTQTLYKTTYHSDLYAQGAGAGNFTVVLQSFSWTYTTQSKNIVDYDIIMVEGQ
tara:strand:- start:3654 stop:4067 length:414 start_codon:yes stop_codon:yes gene_type:complete